MIPKAGPVEPTAKQATPLPSPVHETPLNVFEPDGFGLPATVHAEPSQPATSVLLAMLRCAPTATHAVRETHESAAKPLMKPPLGLGRSVQPPSRRSTSVRLPSPR